MVDRCADRSVGRMRRHAVHEVVPALQSAAVGHHVSGDGDDDSRRVWPVPGGALLCRRESAVADDDHVRSTSAARCHHDARRRRTAAQRRRQPASNVVEPRVRRRARTQPVHADDQLDGHAQLAAVDGRVQSAAVSSRGVDRPQAAR